MRDWAVRRPRGEYTPGSIDWTIPDPPQPMAPDTVDAPWGETYRRCTDGYYRVRRTDSPLSYPAVIDRIDRFRLRWEVLEPGRCYRIVPLPDGDRIAVLWRNADGTYRSGHLAMRGPRHGVWLAENETFRRAATRAELWWLGLGLTRAGNAARSAVKARLRPDESADRAKTVGPRG